MLQDWVLLHPSAHLGMLGIIPQFLDEKNPQSAQEQININYDHGGGWISMRGFSLLPDLTLTYPEDPPLPCLMYAQFREQKICIYRYSIVAIISPDGSFDVSRLD